MKRVLILILFVVLLSGCMKQEDYYTADIVNSKFDKIERQLKDQADYIQEQADYIQELEERLAPTATQRYFYSLLDQVLFDDSIHFVEIGTTVYGDVEGYDYGNIVIEMDFAQDVYIEIVDFLPVVNFKLNIYPPGTLTNTSYSFSNVTKGSIYSVRLEAGFNTIELDNYSSSGFSYTIKITEA